MLRPDIQLLLLVSLVALVLLPESAAQYDLLHSSHERRRDEDRVSRRPIRGGSHSLGYSLARGIKQRRHLAWQELGCPSDRPTPSPKAYVAAGDTPTNFGDDSPIKVVGTTIAGAPWWCNCNATINLPSGTKDGDMLILLAAGSYGVRKAWLNDTDDTARLGRLISDGWEPIVKAGAADLNIIALYKVYDAKQARQKKEQEQLQTQNATDIGNIATDIKDEEASDTPFLTVIGQGVRNTWLSLVTLRGVDLDRPVRASSYLKTKSSKTCKTGEAMAPSVRMSRRGVVLAIFTYDDPHQGTIISPRGFHSLSSFRSGDDGMTLGISATPTDGMKSGEIEAIGKSKISGGGQAIGMSISFRAS